eukprot:6202015-Pleurochrysis_carterae.AAC.1
MRPAGTRNWHAPLQCVAANESWAIWPVAKFREKHLLFAFKILKPALSNAMLVLSGAPTQTLPPP